MASSEPYFPAADIDEILADVRDVLEHNGLRSTTHRSRFEEAFAAAHHAAHALAVTNGSTAIEAVLRVAGVAGAEVLVPANTFIATAAIPYTMGARLRFLDMDPATLAPTADDVAAAIGPATRLLIMVHMGGLISPEMPEIMRICQERGVVLLEDAAQATGASLDGRFAGAWGLAATHSTYPTKVITSGEGGVVVTGDAELAAQIGSLREQGRSAADPLVHDRVGTNYRMTEIQAIVAYRQTLRIPEIIAARQRIMRRYAGELEGLRHLIPMTWDPRLGPSGYKFWLHLDAPEHKAGLQHYALSRGIDLPSGIQDVPVHQQPALAHLGPVSMPRAERFCRQHACLPVYPNMTSDDVARVIGMVRDYDRNAR